MDLEATERLRPVFDAVMAAMPELAASAARGEAPAVQFQCAKHHVLGTLTIAPDHYVGWRLEMPDAPDSAVLAKSRGHGMGSALDDGRGRFDANRSTFICRTCGARRSRRALGLGEGRRFEAHTYTAQALLRGYVWALKRHRQSFTVLDLDNLGKAHVSIEDLITQL